MSGDAGKRNATTLQMKEEQDIVRHQTPPGQHFDCEEIRPRQDGHVRGHEVLPRGGLTPLRCRRDTVATEGIPDRLVRDVVAQVSEGAGDSIVALSCILLGHTDEESLHIGSDAWPPGIRAML